MALHYAVDAACIRPYSVYLKFDDGTEGVIDLDSVVGSGGVFDPLVDRVFFSQGRFDAQLRTIAWPNGADLSPCVLYDKIKSGKPGQPVEF